MAEQIVKLEEKITELEEEKGNLQLKLVDFEDLANSGKGGFFLNVNFFGLISTTFEFSNQNYMDFSLKLTFQLVKFD